jgi:hypothetical protein
MENEFITTPSGHQQVVLPSLVSPYVNAEQEAWLLGRGWERDPASGGIPAYRDPKGSKLKPELRPIKTLPTVDGKGETLHQLVLPPGTFSFSLGEALEIQRRREETGDTGPSLLDRLGECEQRCNDLQDQLARLRGRVKAILAARQMAPEAVLVGLRELIGGHDG